MGNARRLRNSINGSRSHEVLRTARKRAIHFLLLAAIACPVCSGQVIVPERGGSSVRLEKQVFGLGFAAGPTTGLGISFRHHLPSRLSYGIIGGVIRVNRDFSYDVGFEAQWDLSRSQTARVFAVSGLSFFYSGTSDKNKLDGPLRYGIGIGGEFSQGGSVHVGVEGLFTYFSDGTILPLPQVNAHFYFN